MKINQVEIKKLAGNIHRFRNSIKEKGCGTVDEFFIAMNYGRDGLNFSVFKGPAEVAIIYDITNIDKIIHSLNSGIADLIKPKVEELTNDLLGRYDGKPVHGSRHGVKLICASFSENKDYFSDTIIDDDELIHCRTRHVNHAVDKTILEIHLNNLFHMKIMTGVIEVEI